MPITKDFFSERTAATANAEGNSVDFGTPAFGIFKQKYSEMLRDAISVSSRARPLFDTDPSTSNLRKIILQIESRIRTPFAGRFQDSCIPPNTESHQRRRGAQVDWSSTRRYSSPQRHAEVGADSRNQHDDSTESALPSLTPGSQKANDDIRRAMQEQERFEMDIELLRNPQLWRCFPPCMFRLVDHLDQTHHLKYDSRVQLMIFLRSVGVSVSEAVLFLREEFAKDDKMTLARYSNKRYEYLVRHIYGREGRGVPWATHKCTRIQKSRVTATVSAQQAPRDWQIHGCPFVTCTTPHALGTLVDAHVGAAGVRRRRQHAASRHVGGGDSSDEDEGSESEDDEKPVSALNSVQAGTGASSEQVSKLLKLARTNPSLACQHHFAMNLDLLDHDLGYKSPTDDVHEFLADIGIGGNPASYFHAATAVLRARQQADQRASATSAGASAASGGADARASPKQNANPTCSNTTATSTTSSSVGDSQ